MLCESYVAIVYVYCTYSVIVFTFKFDSGKHGGSGRQCYCKKDHIIDTSLIH